jgi:hypothetical protein
MRWIGCPEKRGDQENGDGGAIVKPDKKTSFYLRDPARSLESKVGRLVASKVNDTGEGVDMRGR